LANHAVQVILSEQHMPEMNDTELMSRVREHIREAFRHQEASTQHQRYPAGQK
jgi:PleD family two-component response regulator